MSLASAAPATARLRLGHRLVLAAAGLLLTLRHPIMVLRCRQHMRHWPNLAYPRQLWERALWRKILDRNPLFVTFCDKLATKDYIAARVPELGLPRTLWVGDAPEALPDLSTGEYMLKTNNSCGKNLFVRDGRPGREEIVAKAQRWLRIRGRREEWAYGQVVPKLFVEERLALGGDDLPTDLKVYMCSGHVVCAWAVDKLRGLSRTYDRHGTALATRDTDFPGEDQALPPFAPAGQLARRAAELAVRIAGQLDYIRVDFLVTADGGLLGGEITVYPGGGFDEWLDKELMAEFVRAWDLRRSHFVQRSHRGPARLYVEALSEAFASGVL